MHGAISTHCYNKEKDNGHICREKDPPKQQCTGCQKMAEERGGGRRRHDEAPSKTTWKRWVSAGMDPAGSPVTVKDGDFSSPDAPRGTGGPNSK